MLRRRIESGEIGVQSLAPTMMNISALRHNAENNDPVSSESEEGEDSLTPWPEHVPENALHAPYVTQAEHQWTAYEWSNRSGKSTSRDFPKEQQYPINLFGHTAEQTFADFPEPHDLSSGEDDNFAAHFPETRPRQPRSPSSHYAVSNERRTQDEPQLSPSSSNLNFRSMFPGLYQSNSYDYTYRGSSSSRGDATPFLEPNGPGLPRITIGSYTDDETGRRRGKQLFDQTEVDQQFLNTPGITSPLSKGPSGDISAKAKGKQRFFEDAEDSMIPNVQMSGLRLGVDHQPKGTRTSPRLESKDDDGGNGRSRSSTLGSVYFEEDEDEEYGAEKRPRKPASQSLTTGSRSRRSRTAASRSGKRPVTSEEEEDSALDQSVETLPPPITSPSKPSGKKRKVNRYPCPVPLCKETFTRRNDVRRHIRNAAVHRDSPEALALLGEAVGAGTRCKFCNADLSRSDARMRHERASACGKRTTQKMKDQMLMRT
ncbi:hypothetical protein DFH05DRAFT_673691 [Lentinula detonsa]|uniref:C2H2-type domain-containing protein n=1 Tax=Lentinula detonsa TaxID=2804962 RepID=A0A9W8P9M4_9AGAR|nr:hypothetical protein DFH05DRAFT_673691 [Lentinula detonsa]